MNRLQTNILIDIALLLAMAALSFSGFVIKVLMPSGGGMHRRGGMEKASEVLGMTRHSWKDLHLWAGIVLVILLVVHIALHWKMIDGFFRKSIPHASARYLCYAFLLAVSAVTVLPWVFAMG